MYRTAQDLSNAAQALLDQTMSEQHWQTVDDTLESLRARYRFFDQSASYCFDAGWGDTLRENEHRLNELRPRIEGLAAGRQAPTEAARILLELASQSAR